MVGFEKTSIRVTDGPIYIFAVFTTYPDKREIEQIDIEYTTNSIINLINTTYSMKEFHGKELKERNVYPIIVGPSKFRIETVIVLEVDLIGVQELGEVLEALKEVAEDRPELKLQGFNIISEQFAEQHIQTSGG